MSIEAAKKVLKELNKADFVGKSQEEAEQYLKEKGYDCTLKELKKVSILETPLSEDELEKVAGGVTYFDRSRCSGSYYNEACTDTVEADSNCWSGDYNCRVSGRDYTCTASKLTTEDYDRWRDFDDFCDFDC